MVPGSYYSSPSGRDILKSKLETIVEDYNKQGEEEAKVGGRVTKDRKVIQKVVTSSSYIKVLRNNYLSDLSFHASY